MNAQSRLAVSILTLLSAQYGGQASTEVCGPEQEASPMQHPGNFAYTVLIRTVVLPGRNGLRN